MMLNLILYAGVAAVALVANRKAQASVDPSGPVLSVNGADVGQWSLDIDVLARTICAEDDAGGWSGMQGVANVVMNRYALAVRNSGYWWGNDISSICWKHSGNVYQFDCWRPGTPNYDRAQNFTPDYVPFQQALQIAAMAVSGQLPDLTGGATNYYAPKAMPGGVPPVWARGQQILASIGGHLFFNVG